MSDPARTSGQHRSGKAMTVGLIVGGVVLAGLVGGLVAVVAGDDESGAPSSRTTTPGTGVLDPTPVGSIGAPSSEPSPPESSPPASSPAEPGEEPVVPGTAEQEPPGTGVDVGGVTVFLPDDWSVMGDVGPDNAAFTNGDGSWVYVLTGVVEPTADAASLLSGTLDYFVGGDSYSQVEVGDITPLEPFGSIVSGAYADYRATWVDAQGSMPLRGAIWSAVRQDGTALVMSAEHAPPSGWKRSVLVWGPLLDATFSQFGAG